MKENTSIKEIFDKLKSSKRILIALHRGPDGDSLGCCTAMKYVLENNFGLNVKVISADNLDRMLKEFSEEVVFDCKIEEIDLSFFDALITLDFGSLKGFTSLDVEEIKKKIFLMNIDHHISNEYFGDLNYVDPVKPSCCNVLFDMFKELDIDFDSELSTRLLLGIYTDTGGFVYDDGRSLKEAVFLIDRGANYKQIVENIKFNFPLQLMRYDALLVDNFELLKINNFNCGCSVVSKEEIEKLNLNLSEIRGGINHLQKIGGIDFLFTLVEMEDKIKGSFRSRNVDISLFAKALGGGGHKAAASFVLEKMPLDEAKQKVLEVIDKVGVCKI
ncbi:bifunctional oligoribonuclease/PAP phosphatase NrnA [Nanoarchaeota archaeon]